MKINIVTVYLNLLFCRSVEKRHLTADLNCSICHHLRKWVGHIRQGAWSMHGEYASGYT